MEITVVSYNIHKGFNIGNRAYMFPRLKEELHRLNADIVFLQEIHGEHPDEKFSCSEPLELLADSLWPHFSYGKNSVYEKGHHGNAILSKFPILEWDNINISTNTFERRGLLHCVVDLPATEYNLHLLCLHLNLLEGSRRQQIKNLVDRIHNNITNEELLIIGGDFNDWRNISTKTLKKKLNVHEPFNDLHKKIPKTYPSVFPVMALDRIFFRGFHCMDARVLNDQPWPQLSDHLPLYLKLKI